MSAEFDREELWRLFQQTAEGLREDEQQRLEEILRSSPEARAFWFLQHDVELGLSEWVSASAARRAMPVGGSVFGPESRRGAARKPWGRYALVAALAVSCALAGVWVSEWRRFVAVDAQTPDATPMRFVATLASERNCAWQGASLRVGQRLAAGTLRLVRGQALLNFDGGARLVVMGPAELALNSPGSARLISGMIAVRAPEEAAGFKVATGEGTLVDLGTEFTLAVNAQGETECQVTDGEVQWHPAAGDQKVAMLTEGEARRFRHGAAETIAPMAGSYRDFLPRIAPESTGVQLLAYEPFDYAAETLPAEQATGGRGWKAPWRGRFIATDEVDLAPMMHLATSASLEMPAGLQPGKGGALKLNEWRQWRLRALPEPVNFGEDGVYYVSCLARREAGAEPAAANGRMSIDFRCSANYWEHWIGFAVSLANQPMIIADGNNRWSDRQLPAGQTLFLVCKIAASREGPDQLFMKVYAPGEAVEREETAQWTVVGPDLRLRTAMDYLVVGAWGGIPWTVDELRYGRSWNAVVPFREEAAK